MNDHASNLQCYIFCEKALVISTGWYAACALLSLAMVSCLPVFTPWGTLSLLHHCWRLQTYTCTCKIQSQCQCQGHIWATSKLSDQKSPLFLPFGDT